MEEFERLSKNRDEAKLVYDEAERGLASARYTLNFHERALTDLWNKMVRSNGQIPVG